jgi:hypothetical protein
MIEGKMATVEEIEKKTYKNAMHLGLDNPDIIVMELCPTCSVISEVPLLEVVHSDDAHSEDYEPDQCVLLDDVQFSRSLSIPVTITESVSGSTLLDKVVIYVKDYNTATTYSSKTWNCGSVNGSSSNTMTISLPTDMYNNTYYLSVYVGKTGGNRTFTFTAQYQTFKITKKYSSIKELTWSGSGTAVVNTVNILVPDRGALNVNYPQLCTPNACVLGGLNVEKLQKITIAIS